MAGRTAVEARTIALFAAAVLLLALVAETLVTTPRSSLGDPTSESSSETARAATATSALTISVNGLSQLQLGWVGEYSADVTGGTRPYEYAWTIDGSPQYPLIPNVLEFRPLFDGIFDLNASVRDANGSTSWSIFQVSVQGPSPVSVRLVALSTTPDGRIVLEADVSGGTPPYEFIWAGPGANGSRTYSAVWATSPLGAGRYTVSVTVTDELGYAGLAQVPIIVQSGPGGGLAWWTWGVALVGSFAIATAVALIVGYLRVKRKGARPTDPRP